MNALTVKKCSEALRGLLLEHHNALDARVRQQIEEVAAQLEAAAEEGSSEARHRAVLAISNFLRSATNIALLISKFGDG